jgi:cytochrome c5
MTGGEVDAPTSPTKPYAPTLAAAGGVVVLASVAGGGVVVLASSANVCAATSWSGDLVREGEAWAPRSRWGSTTELQKQYKL